MRQKKQQQPVSWQRETTKELIFHSLHCRQEKKNPTEFHRHALREVLISNLHYLHGMVNYSQAIHLKWCQVGNVVGHLAEATFILCKKHPYLRFYNIPTHNLKKCTHSKITKHMMKQATMSKINKLFKKQYQTFFKLFRYWCYQIKNIK